MDNLISRQAALDGLSKLRPRMIDTYEKDGDPFLKVRECDVNDMLEGLPPAQPEIILCKDCKHRDPEDKKCDCGHDILWQLPRRDNWYCADAERRTE